MLENFRTFPTSPTDEQIAYFLKHLSYSRIDNWLDTDFNTIRWWVEVVLFIISLIVWWKLVDRKRLLELTFYGFTIMTACIGLDEIGYEIGLWYYPIDLVPLFPPSSVIDYIMLPIIYALVYQYCRSWQSFTFAIFLLAGLFCFILEPLLVMFGFYVPIKWKFYYGFPIYIAIGIIMKMIVEKIKVIMANSHEQSAK